MRLLPALVKAGIIVTSVLIMLWLVLNLMSLLLPGNLQVEVPQSSDWSISIQGRTLVIDGPVRVFNGAQKPIEDVSVDLLVNDSQGNVIAMDSTDPITIRTNGWTDLPIHFEVDVSAIPQETLNNLAFRNESLGVSIGVRASYLYQMFKLDLDLGLKQTMGSMVKDIVVSTDQTTIQERSGIYFMEVPASFTTEDWLAGQTLWVNTTLSNDTSLLGASHQSFIVQSNNMVTISIALGPGVAEHLAMAEDDLVVSATFGVLGAEMQQDYSFHWTPPGA